MKLPDLDKLRIIHFPDPILKKVCTPVTEFGEEIKAFANRLIALMREGEGVGLAAPQVGIPLRLFVCNATGEPEDDTICVNPRFIELTGGMEKQEGCLSLPELSVIMRRAQRVVMEVFNVDGQRQEWTGEDLVARIWQHETDHLDGRLITDNMSVTDEITNRRAIKQLEADYAASHRNTRKRRCGSSS